MINSILIAGGGSAGWITANILAAVLNKTEPKRYKITLIESPDIPIVGVGEATVPSIRKTLQLIGISERDFMRETDATFKNLIRFTNWNLGTSFDHPFDRRERPDTDGAVINWLAKAGGQPTGNGFAEMVSIMTHLSNSNRAPKAAEWPDYGSPFPYAYHLDAVKFAKFLTRLGTQRGVEHILAKISDVEVSEGGEIGNLILDNGEKHSADLYIDCTGFASVLSGKALGVSEQEFGHYLLCDRAVTFRIPNVDDKTTPLPPFTTATARTSGWNWDIPLQNRRGIGYVYSSAHLSDSEAEEELRIFIGSECKESEARYIKFKSYKRQKSWAGNCISIGLSDGFLEPLESSGLYMIEFAAQAVAENLSATRKPAPAMIRNFNKTMNNLYDEVLDYLNLHYVTSERRDTPFWIDATSDARITDTNKERLDIWAHKPPSDLDFDNILRLFSLESHEYLLFGMGRLPQVNVPDGPLLNLSAAIEKSITKLPLHRDLISQLV